MLASHLFLSSENTFCNSQDIWGHVWSSFEQNTNKITALVLYFSSLNKHVQHFGEYKATRFVFTVLTLHSMVWKYICSIILWWSALLHFTSLHRSKMCQIWLYIYLLKLFLCKGGIVRAKNKLRVKLNNLEISKNHIVQL